MRKRLWGPHGPFQLLLSLLALCAGAFIFADAVTCTSSCRSPSPFPCCAQGYPLCVGGVACSLAAYNPNLPYSYCFQLTGNECTNDCQLLMKDIYANQDCVCDSSCATCTGPAVSNCNSCPADYQLELVNVADMSGRCVSDIPTQEPTNLPTDTPTGTPTNSPTDTPTDTPTDAPTNAPTNMPTDAPTEAPTITPTDAPLCSSDQVLHQTADQLENDPASSQWTRHPVSPSSIVSGDPSVDTNAAQQSLKPGDTTLFSVAKTCANSPTAKKIKKAVAASVVLADIASEGGVILTIGAEVGGVIAGASLAPALVVAAAATVLAYRIGGASLMLQLDQFRSSLGFDPEPADSPSSAVDGAKIEISNDVLPTCGQSVSDYADQLSQRIRSWLPSGGSAEPCRLNTDGKRRSDVDALFGDIDYRAIRANSGSSAGPGANDTVHIFTRFDGTNITIGTSYGDGVMLYLQYQLLNATTLQPVFINGTLRTNTTISLELSDNGVSTTPAIASDDLIFGAIGLGIWCLLWFVGSFIYQHYRRRTSSPPVFEVEATPPVDLPASHQSTYKENVAVACAVIRPFVVAPLYGVGAVMPITLLIVAAGLVILTTQALLSHYVKTCVPGRNRGCCSCTCQTLAPQLSGIIVGILAVLVGLAHFLISGLCSPTYSNISGVFETEACPMLMALPVVTYIMQLAILCLTAPIGIECAVHIATAAWLWSVSRRTSSSSRNAKTSTRSRPASELLELSVKTPDAQTN